LSEVLYAMAEVPLALPGGLCTVWRAVSTYV